MEHVSRPGRHVRTGHSGPGGALQFKHELEMPIVQVRGPWHSHRQVPLMQLIAPPSCDHGQARSDGVGPQSPGAAQALAASAAPPSPMGVDPESAPPPSRPTAPSRGPSATGTRHWQRTTTSARELAIATGWSRIGTVAPAAGARAPPGASRTLPHTGRSFNDGVGLAASPSSTDRGLKFDDSTPLDVAGDFELRWSPARWSRSEPGRPSRYSCVPCTRAFSVHDECRPNSSRVLTVIAQLPLKRVAAPSSVALNESNCSIR